jgi:hypothetical protein
MIIGHSAWRGRHQTGARARLLAVAAVLTAATAIGLSTRQPVWADDGSLETQKGGLFHRKGWISAEIYRAKPRPTKAARTGGSRTSRTRRGRSNMKRRAASRHIPREVIKRRERQIARRTEPVSKPVRVASLSTTVPLAITATGPELNITGGSPPISVSGGAPRVKWRANSGCLAARLRAAIHHVARHYGQVRVNSTCRSRRHNRRVGGARRSYHIGGRAADIRVFGNVRAAARFLRRISGGYKHYGGGLFHVDTGPRRTW